MTGVYGESSPMHWLLVARWTGGRSKRHKPPALTHSLRACLHHGAATPRNDEQLLALGSHGGFADLHRWVHSPGVGRSRKVIGGERGSWGPGAEGEGETPLV